MVLRVVVTRGNEPATPVCIMSRKLLYYNILYIFYIEDNIYSVIYDCIILNVVFSFMYSAFLQLALQNRMNKAEISFN